MTTQTRKATLRWTGKGLQFEGVGAGPSGILIDGDSEAGPSPMEVLLLSVGGCMAVDIQMILEKGRVPLEDLTIGLEGDRAPSSPKRFINLRMTIRVAGPEESHRPKVERAVQLSKDKYCSVFHTLQPDLEVETEVHLA